jgi:hypothetical protein
VPVQFVEPMLCLAVSKLPEGPEWESFRKHSEPYKGELGTFKRHSLGVAPHAWRVCVLKTWSTRINW